MNSRINPWKDELESIDMAGLPKFFPTIGMADSTVNELLEEMTAG